MLTISCRLCSRVCASGPTLLTRGRHRILRKGRSTFHIISDMKISNIDVPCPIVMIHASVCKRAQT